MDPLAGAKEEVDPLAHAKEEDPLAGAKEEPAPVQVKGEQVPRDRIDLNAPQVKVADWRLKPVTPMAKPGDSVWWDNTKASLSEDWRRTKQFLGTDVPNALGSAWDAQSQVGDFLANGDALSEEGTQVAGTPYADPNHPARQLDAFLRRPPLEQLQVIGHGIAPDTISYPGEPKDTRPGVVTQVSAAKDKAFAPVVSGIESGQEFLRPAVEAMVPNVDTLMENIDANPNWTPEEKAKLKTSLKGKMAAQEVLFREAATAFGGPKVGPNPELAKTARGITELEQSLGTTGAALAQHGAHELGRLPFYLMTTGAGQAATATERAAIMSSAKLTAPFETRAAIAKLGTKEGFFEGLAQGGVQTALTPGQDVVTGPAVMGLLGALGGHEAGGPMAEKVVMDHHGAAIPAKTWDEFIAGVNRLTDAQGPVAPTNRAPGPLGRTVGDLSPKTAKLVLDLATGKIKDSPLVNLKPTKKGVIIGPPEDFDPLTAVVTRNAQGQRVGREIQVNFSTPGQADITFRDTPIRNAQDAKSWHRNIKHYSSMGGPAEAEFNILYGSTIDDRAVGTPDYMSPEQIKQFPQGAHEAAKLERQAFLAVPKEKLPGKGTNAGPVVAVVNEKGNLKAIHVADPTAKDPATWKLAPGDLVMTPDGEARVVQGFTHDGRVLAKKPMKGGKGAAYRNEDLKFISDKEGLGLLSTKPANPSPVGLPDAEAAPIPSDIQNVIDGLHTVTVPRLSAILGMNPVEAGQVIEHLMANNKLYTTSEPGVYGVTKLPKIEGLRYEPWGELPTDPLYGKTTKHGEEGPSGPGWQRAEGPVKFPGARVPGLDEPVAQGMEVWYGMSSTGKPLKGVLRGPDPEHPGHYLLEIPPADNFIDKLEHAGALSKLPGVVDKKGNPVLGVGEDKTTIRSIPAGALRTTVPVNMAKPALQKFMATPGLYGVTVPHPPNFVVTSAGNREAIKQAAAVANQTRMPAGIKGAIDRLQGALLNSYYLTPPMLRRKATPLYATWAASRDAMLRISERLKEGTGGYGTQADKDLLAVAESSALTGEQHKAMMEWASKHPTESVELMDTLRSLLDERKQLSQWLADRGLAHIDMLELARGAGEEPEYVTMMYNVHVLKEKYPEWVKKNAPHLWDGAVEELARGSRNAAQVESELADIMRQSDPLKALGQSNLVDKAAFAKLLARKDIKSKYPKIYALMGPVPSASLRLGHTIGYQRALKMTIQTWDAIADSPWWSHGPREDLMLPIPNEPRFGKAAGGYTHESLKDFIIKKPEERAIGWAKMLGWMGGKWKSFNTVYGGLAPYVNNFLRNGKGLALSGAIHGPEDYEAFRRAPSLLLAWRKNPSMLGPANIVGEAQQFGALSSGFAGAEIHDARTRIQGELLRAMSRAGGTSGTIEDIMMGAQDFLRKSAENTKDTYDAIDQVFKLGTYMNLRKRFIAKGMNVHDAASKATEIVRASYPDFATVGPLVEQMRSKAGWAAPFLSSKAEDLRINAMTMARIARTLDPRTPADLREPDLILRLAVLSAGIYGASAYMTALRRSNGMTDQDVKDGQNALTLKQQSWRPALIPMWDYDDKGRMQFIDLTPVDDLFMMLRGNAQDPVLARLFVNNVTDIMGQDTLPGRQFQHGMQNLGVISTPPDEMKPVGYGEGGVLQFMGDFARNGGIPQAPLRLMDALQKGQARPESPTWDQWTPGQVAGKALGLPVAGPAGPGSMISSLKEAKGQVRELRHEAKGIPRRLGSEPQRDKFLLDAKLRGLGSVQQRIQQIQVPPKKENP